MENATKALIIAAGVLIGVMILSLAAALYAELGSYVKTSQEEIKFNEISAFNAQFTKYTQNSELKIQDVVTVANLAHENNVKYNVFEQSNPNPSSLYVAVYLDKRPIEFDINNNSAQLLADNLGNTYTCNLEYSEQTGRVYIVNFNKK